MAAKGVTDIELVQNCRTEHLENFAAALRKLRTTQRLTDVILVCQEKEFAAHKNILESSSTYFEEMFTSSFKEAQSNRVELPTIHPDTMDFILQFLYLDSSLDLAGRSFENYVKIFKSSHLLGIESLTKFCSRQIELALDLQSVFEVWQLMPLYEDSFKVDVIKDFLLLNREVIVKDERFLEANDVQMNMLMDAMIDVPIDDECLKALLKWAKRDMPKRKKRLCDSLQRLKCHCLTKAYMERVIQEPEVYDEKEILFAMMQLCLKTVKMPDNAEAKEAEVLQKTEKAKDCAIDQNAAADDLATSDLTHNAQSGIPTTKDNEPKNSFESVFSKSSTDDLFCYCFGCLNNFGGSKNEDLYLQKVNIRTGAKKDLIALPHDLSNILSCRRHNDKLFVLGKLKECEVYVLYVISHLDIVKHVVPFNLGDMSCVTIADDSSIGWLDDKNMYHYNTSTKLCKLVTLENMSGCTKQIIALDHDLYVISNEVNTYRYGSPNCYRLYIYRLTANGLRKWGELSYSFLSVNVAVLQKKIYFFLIGVDDLFKECYACEPHLTGCTFYQCPILKQQVAEYKTVFKSKPYPMQHDFMFKVEAKMYMYEPLTGKISKISNNLPSDVKLLPNSICF